MRNGLTLEQSIRLRNLLDHVLSDLAAKDYLDASIELAFALSVLDTAVGDTVRAAERTQRYEDD
jgi:hypothetical protein